MASGDVLAVLLPSGYAPPATNYATWGTRNSEPHLAFDDTTQEVAVWTAELPDNYGGGGITVTVRVRMTSATSGAVVFDGAFERGDSDIDADSFATAQISSSTNVSATSGITVNVSIAFTNAQIDSLAAGEKFRFRLRRVPADSGDTATGDAEVVSVKLKET